MPKTWAMEWRGTLGRLLGNNVVSSIVACTLASLSILNICSKVRNVSSFHDFYLCLTLLPHQFNRFSDFSHAHAFRRHIDRNPICVLFKRDRRTQRAEKEPDVRKSSFVRHSIISVDGGWKVGIIFDQQTSSFLSDRRLNGGRKGARNKWEEKRRACCKRCLSEWIMIMLRGARCGY